MKNSLLFLNSFSEIESYLQRYTNTYKHESFTNLVNKASRTNSIVRQYKADLLELKDLEMPSFTSVIMDRLLLNPMMGQLN